MNSVDAAGRGGSIAPVTMSERERETRRLAADLAPLARDAQARAALDDGGGLGAASDILAAETGLAFVADDASPADLTLCFRVLERLAEPDLEERLAALRARSPKAIIVVSCVLDEALTPDGANAHRTVRPCAWWRALVERHFGQAFASPLDLEEACVVTTWTPSAEALAAFNRRIAAARWRKRATRRWRRLVNAARLMRRPALNEADLRALLDGKSVAIVGNALSLAQRDYGAEIDAHDLVVRFNAARIPQARSHGWRTDWIATGIPLSQDAAVLRGAAQILWMAPNRKNIPTWMPAWPGGFYLHAREAHDALGEEIGAPRPSTGAMLVDLVMRAPGLRRASMFGFDFFTTLSVSPGHTAASAPHDFAKEKVFMRALAERDARLTIRT